MNWPTQAMMEKLLREWQATLRLQDWDVKIDLRREKTMRVDQCEGLNHYHTALKTSVIQIRHPLDDPADAYFPPDVEATIVHELLHLHFAPFCATKGLVNVLQEQAIEVIARSLVGLKRKAQAQTMAAKKSSGKGKPATSEGGAKPPAPKPAGGKKGGKGRKAC